MIEMTTYRGDEAPLGYWEQDPGECDFYCVNDDCGGVEVDSDGDGHIDEVRRVAWNSGATIYGGDNLVPPEPRLPDCPLCGEAGEPIE